MKSTLYRDLSRWSPPGRASTPSREHPIFRLFSFVFAFFVWSWVVSERNTVVLCCRYKARLNPGVIFDWKEQDVSLGAQGVLVRHTACWRR